MSLKHLNAQVHHSSEGDSCPEQGDQLLESTSESSCIESTMEVSLDFFSCGDFNLWPCSEHIATFYFQLVEFWSIFISDAIIFLFLVLESHRIWPILVNEMTI